MRRQGAVRRSEVSAEDGASDMSCRTLGRVLVLSHGEAPSGGSSFVDWEEAPVFPFPRNNAHVHCVLIDCICSLDTLSTGNVSWQGLAAGFTSLSTQIKLMQ